MHHIQNHSNVLALCVNAILRLIYSLFLLHLHMDQWYTKRIQLMFWGFLKMEVQKHYMDTTRTTWEKQADIVEII